MQELMSQIWYDCYFLNNCNNAYNVFSYWCSCTQIELLLLILIQLMLIGCRSGVNIPILYRLGPGLFLSWNDCICMTASEPSDCSEPVPASEAKNTLMVSVIWSLPVICKETKGIQEASHNSERLGQLYTQFIFNATSHPPPTTWNCSRTVPF